MLLIIWVVDTHTGLGERLAEERGTQSDIITEKKEEKLVGEKERERESREKCGREKGKENTLSNKRTRER